MVLFEAAPRLEKLLSELVATLGPREAFLAREMTKKFEEHRFGSLDALRLWVSAAGAKLKGELTLVVAAKSSSVGRSEASASGPNETDLRARYRDLSEAGLTRREAAKRIAKETGFKTRAVYQALLRE